MRLQIEAVERRVLLAVTASFTPASGTLSVFGDALDNTITISRNAAGTILVNGGAVAVAGGTPTVANTALIQVFGQAGNDTITMNEANGALPAANLFGGTENDVLTGGSGGDQLFGQSGNDVLLGKGGLDFLFGGSENDVLTGGDANDQVFGESGNDRMIWNPGDDTDLNEGGADTDTVEVNGGGGAEVFTVTANGTRVRFDRLDPAPFSIDIGTSENLVLNMNGGNDAFSATGNLAALIQITADGGAGNDTVLGSNGIDLLLGGDGDDFIDGQQGNDVAFLGAGNDVFQWDPGDGSDVVEGQDGTDTMRFNGSAGAEIFTASANGGRVLFTRNLGNIVMDLNDVEGLDLNALGNTDTVTVNDLSGTDLVELNINLEGILGSATGDAAADVVIVNGTNGNDIIDVFGAGTSAAVVGLAAQVNITSSEGANDSLVVNALGGNDGVTATTMPAGVIKLTMDGGAGSDNLLGSQGADVFLGGDGNDFIFGDNGNDTALMGAGDDVFQWDPGDGNDVIEGQANADTMLFFGSNASENISVSANGGRVIFFRDIASVTMDLDDVERIDYRALGGADNIVVGDLSGTDVTQIGLDLRGPNGGGDGAADTVTVNATQGADVFGASGDAGGVGVFGLQASVNLFFQEQANDRLTLNGLGGDDVINATALQADGIQLTENGGLGIDDLRGSQGNDLINGGDGNDLTTMGGGDDVFVWNPGDDNDVIEGQAGTDELLFNGANVAEIIDISANGQRLRFFRNVASVVMDADGVETVTYNALGGADVITVNALDGTAVKDVNLNLQAAGGAGDAQPDHVFVRGSDAANTLQVNGSASGVSFTGLWAAVNVVGHEPAIDLFTLLPLGGADSVTINNMTGIDGTQITVDLTDDAQADQVIVNANASPNTIAVADTAAGTEVTGLSPKVTIAHADASLDSLRINALGGLDNITVNQTGTAGAVRGVLVDGGDSADTINVLETAANGSVTILPGAANDTVNVNADGIGFAAARFNATQRIGTLNIQSGGVATLTSGGSKVLTVISLSIGGTGRLDLTNNDLIIDYTIASPIAAVQALLSGGYNGGLWNGSGIRTSLGDYTTFALGYAEASDVAPYGSFSGQPVDATAVLVKYTYYGDATLNGQVEVGDLGRLASNWQQSPRRWAQGNFNYDAPVNVADLGLLATNWQKGTVTPLAPAMPAISLASSGTIFAARRSPLGGAAVSASVLS